MKKTFLLLIAALMMTTSAYALGTETIIRLDNLPVAAQKTIEKTFKKAEIAVVKKEEIPFIHTEYKVIFQNGTAIEFDDTGTWKEIKGAIDGVPASIIPQKISDYVKSKYPGAKIVGIEREDSEGFKVKLSNKFKLEFSNIYNLTDIERDDD